MNRGEKVLSASCAEILKPRELRKLYAAGRIIFGLYFDRLVTRA